MDRELWEARALVALAGSGPLRGEDEILQQVALSFADQFDGGDREFEGRFPRWHNAIRSALAALTTRGEIEVTNAGSSAVADQQRLEMARDVVSAGEQKYYTATEALGSSQATEGREREEPLLISGVITPALRSGSASTRGSEIPVDDRDASPMMVELNLRFTGGADAAFKQLKSLWHRLPEVSALQRADGDPPDAKSSPVQGVRLVTEEYATVVASMSQVKRLVAADAVGREWPRRAIYRVWPDFKVGKHIDVSSVTVKADASQRSFNAYGQDIVWAVIDSGIDSRHAHFQAHNTLLDQSVKDLHRYFPGSGLKPTRVGALVDEDGHGTHVAGIIGGGLRGWQPKKPGLSASDAIFVAEDRFNVENPSQPMRQPRRVADPEIRLAGMAPLAKIVSLKVMDPHAEEQAPETRVSRVMEALAYVRRVNAQNSRSPRIHGVNLSLGYDFNPRWFACGRSPLCQEVDKLVRTGVVVVVAAGNSGFGAQTPDLADPRSFGLVMTINDPGNARLAITVGSTHRDSPHAYGVSYFSSKGPTGDGRRKPDLVAPGERITSAGTGDLASTIVLPEGADPSALYVEQTGTSMAAPHVSGVVAAFLSVRREFIGDPERVKQIFIDSATSLGREPYIEGAGLIDLMRALQSV